MTFTDFLIIYLSIGAPFAVYFFLSRRPIKWNLMFLLKTVCIAFGWCFYAVYLISRNQRKIPAANSISVAENEIDKALTKLLSAFSDVSSSKKFVSFFQFRETAERFAGLSVAFRNSSESDEFENELFKVAGRKKQDLQLANRCLHRKNRLRLKAHQIQARKDFVQIFDNLSEDFSEVDFRQILFAAVQFARSLGDIETENRLNQIKNRIEKQNPQLASQWKASPLEQIPVLQTQSSTLNLAIKNQD